MQIALGSDYIAVINGIDMIVARHSEESNKYIELKAFTEYETMLKGEGWMFCWRNLPNHVFCNNKDYDPILV